MGAQMRRRFKILLIFLSIGLVLFTIVSAWYFHRAVPTFLGYAGKYLCSGVFISGRSPEKILQNDIAPMIFFNRLLRTRVDTEAQEVTVSLAGVVARKAVFRSGCGCTLVIGTTADALRKQIAAKLDPRPSSAPNRSWPDGNRAAIDPLPAGVSRDNLEQALQTAFLEPSSGKSATTRAVVVVYAGRLIAERYAPGFNRNMALPGWSMSKSVINALVAILVQKGRLKLKHSAPVPQWNRFDDPRRAITLDQLLRMSSGLKFGEFYVPPSDVTDMLFSSYDFGAAAADKSLETAPDTKWHYSSGTTNIIAGIIRRAVSNDYQNMVTFARRELFDRLNMHSAVLELDPSGTIVGSSYTFATARDWARLGLLYLQDGVWQGERIFPPGWVAYSRTPALKAPRGQYGAHFWLNAGSQSNPSDRRWPRLPADMFLAWGFQGQYLVIIPSKKLVIVRLGLDLSHKTWDLQDLVAGVLEVTSELP
jgi:CubicO group peptidase (beta-lactamase class C family)